MAASELTAAGFDSLLARLGADRESAGLAYEHIRRRLIRLFEWRGAADPAALADETMSRVARRIAEGIEIRAEDPYAYVAGVAHFVFKEVARRARHEREAAQALALPEPSPPDRRMACLERCLDTLPAPGRDLLLDYYDGEGRPRIERRARLAASLGLDGNALRVRVHRLRENLESCLTRCLGPAADGRVMDRGRRTPVSEGDEGAPER